MRDRVGANAVAGKDAKELVSVDYSYDFKLGRVDKSLDEILLLVSGGTG